MTAMQSATIARSTIDFMPTVRENVVPTIDTPSRHDIEMSIMEDMRYEDGIDMGDCRYI